MRSLLAYLSLGSRTARLRPKWRTRIRSSAPTNLLRFARDRQLLENTAMNPFANFTQDQLPELTGRRISPGLEARPEECPAPSLWRGPCCGRAPSRVGQAIKEKVTSWKRAAGTRPSAFPTVRFQEARQEERPPNAALGRRNLLRPIQTRLRSSAF
jgi:hypothetical protein